MLSSVKHWNHITGKLIHLNICSFDENSWFCQTLYNLIKTDDENGFHYSDFEPNSLVRSSKNKSTQFNGTFCLFHRKSVLVFHFEARTCLKAPQIVTADLPIEGKLFRI